MKGQQESQGPYGNAGPHPTERPKWATTPPQPTPTPTALDTPQIVETRTVSGAPTVEPTLAALQLAIYPPEVRTGNPDLDPIIDAVLGHDYPSLKL